MKIFIQAPNSMHKTVSTAIIGICQSSHTNCVFHILQEVGAYLKNVHLRLVKLVRTTNSNEQTSCGSQLVLPNL